MSPSQNAYQIDLNRRANLPIAEGIHQFSVKQIEEGESSSSQNPMWTVTLACLTSGEEGKEVRLWLVMTDSARWRLENFLDAVRAPTSGVAVSSQFIGRKLRAQIIHEPYEGRQVAKVGDMFPITTETAPTAPTSSAPRPKSVAAAPTSKKPSKAIAEAGGQEDL